MMSCPVPSTLDHLDLPAPSQKAIKAWGILSVTRWALLLLLGFVCIIGAFSGINSHGMMIGLIAFFVFVIGGAVAVFAGAVGLLIRLNSLGGAGARDTAELFYLLNEFLSGKAHAEDKVEKVRAYLESVANQKRGLTTVECDRLKGFLDDDSHGDFLTESLAPEASCNQD